ncbi:uncharacterized protein [Dermacentor andersoni]|uniref:uncharacterized protein n=1 Tax=Dermacentor andersoni TaxID=34620 RepID=UPI002417840B|nr:uncharacterized protein LOC129384116 [Dermacentor andersoni]
MTEKTTPPTTTTKATTTTTKTTTPRTTTTTLTPMWKKLLLCSFEATLSPNLTFPEDGLCDISFFQALEGNHTFLKGKGGEYDAALDAFLANAAKQNKSEHGVGLDYYYNGATLKVLKEPVATKTIQELWEKKIYHWAYLNPEVYDLKVENITHLFEILKDIKWKIDLTIKPNRPHYVIYTGSLTSAFRTHIETNAIKDVMWIDGLGITTHFVEDDRRWISGLMMPPTFWARPNETDTAVYSYYMSSAHKNLRKAADDELNHTAFYFTATMVAKQYVPEKAYAYMNPMAPTLVPFFVDIMAYCKNAKYTYGFTEKGVIGSFYMSKEENRFISFDDSKALAKKFCKGKVDLIDIGYGFLAYNVESDDPTNVCGKGAYYRVKFLRRLAEFFRDQFISPDSLKECVKLM